jgi:hypothetical protein
MVLKSAYHVDAQWDIQVVDLADVENHIGQSTEVHKRSGVWDVVIRYRGREIARLERVGDSVRLLALAGGWLLLD